MHLIGRIDPIWDMEEVKNLPYFHEPFNDPATVASWSKTYGRNFDIGQQADHRVQQPVCQQQIEKLFSALGLTRFGFCWYRMLPGDLIPRHIDTYVNYCRYHEVDPEKVVRILVMLEDWKEGHILEIHDETVAQYQAGTFVYWTYGTPHMAGNLGSQPRYTLQITATSQ